MTDKEELGKQTIKKTEIMKTKIENYNKEEFEIEVYFNHSFKGRGSWNIECTVVYEGEERLFKHHTTNAPFIDEINDMKANLALYVEVQKRYFEAYFDDFKETVLEWVEDLNER